MGPRILIVDDEPGVRTLLRMVFERAGFQVRVAADVPEAQALCADGRFEAVLSDVRMPGQSGHELVRWLAAEYPATRTALMSGCDLDCSECPFHTKCLMLSKPFLPNQAVSLVRQLLSESPAPSPLIRLRGDCPRDQRVDGD